MTYVFDYDFVYNGYYSTDSKPDMGFETEKLELAIHGMSLMYSKEGFEGAKLQYLEIANDSNNNVSLIVPGGYRIGEESQFANQKLGFAYELIETSNVREGNIITTATSGTINSLMNSKVNQDTINSVKELVITNNDKDISDVADYADFNSSLSSLINSVSYAETNQNSIWIDISNDTYATDSFYVYSPTEIGSDDFYVEETSKIKSIYFSSIK